MLRSVTTSDYANQIEQYLGEFDGSQYLLADQTCPSLRARYTDGSQIYAVYYGPFDTMDEACQSRPDANSYPRILSRTVPASAVYKCS